MVKRGGWSPQFQQIKVSSRPSFPMSSTWKFPVVETPGFEEGKEKQCKKLRRDPGDVGVILPDYGVLDRPDLLVLFS